VQQLLKEDVLNTTDELLARAAGVADSDELASLYRAQLLHVTDQVRRLVATEDEAGGGGGGAEHSGGRAVAGGDGSPQFASVDAELLHLRKELSLTKLDLAETSMERDELEHKLRTLFKQTDAAAQDALGF